MFIMFKIFINGWNGYNFMINDKEYCQDSNTNAVNVGIREALADPSTFVHSSVAGLCPSTFDKVPIIVVDWNNKLANKDKFLVKMKLS